MREIKFRAWDKTQNKMILDSHLWIHIYPQKNIAIDSVSNFPDFHTAETPCEKVYDARTDLEVMQFTGLKDKNGKEIYESDYLGDWCVFWGSGKYILHNISSGDIIDCNEQNTQNKEITGNRFETPKQHSAMATDF